MYRGSALDSFLQEKENTLMKKIPFLFIVMAVLLIGVSVTLPVKQASAETFSFCGASGGTGGNEYTDSQTQGLIVTEVRIWHGSRIDAIQFVYKNKQGGKIEGTKHGGNGGTLSVFMLQPGETIVKITGKHGTVIDSMQLLTSNGREQRWGGSGGSVNYTYSAPPGSSIFGLFGRAGTYIDALGVILLTK